MEIQLLINALWKKKWILTLVPILVVICAFVIQLFGTWNFKSSAQLGTGITMNDDLIEQSTRFNAYEIQVTFTNVIEMIKSRAVLNQVSYLLLYHDLNSSNKPFRIPSDKELSKKLNFELDKNRDIFIELLKGKIETQTPIDPNIVLEKNLEQLIKLYKYDYETIENELEIKRVNISDYIEIAYLSEDRHLSAFVVNTVCQQFIMYYTSLRENKSNISLESLISIVEQRKKYFDEKVEQLNSFRDNSNIVNSSLESQTRLRQVEKYEEEVAAEQLKMRGLELTLASLNIRLKEAEGVTGTEINKQIIDLRKNINRLNERYILSGQQNQNLLDSVTIYRNQLQRALNLASESAKATPTEVNTLREKRDQAQVELEISRENIRSLRNILESIRSNLNKNSSNEALSIALEKEIEAARTEYLAAQSRYNEAKEKLVTNRISIYQAVIAEPAEKAESRKTIIFMLFSGILSFSICAFVIIVLEISDNTIRTPQQLKKISKMEVAGTIRYLPKELIVQGWQLFNGSNSKNLEVNILSHDISKIRFEIESKNAHVLLVTSTKRGEGKTFFIMSLANSLSLIHKRVLIIDTNFRNNDLTLLLTAKGNISLVIDYHRENVRQITDGNDIDEEKNNYYKNNLITRTSNQMIDIIGSNVSPFSPSELISGRDFKVLMEWLKVQYDCIILEGANLNEFSDSRELIKFVDLVIPIFSTTTALSDDDKESLIFLKSITKPVLSVLNKYRINY